MTDCINTKSSELEVHQRLISLISEEAMLIYNLRENLKEKERREEILDFLIELQSISSRRIKCLL